MKKDKIKIIVFFLLFFHFLSGKICFAQSSKIDSLKQLIKVDRPDTNKVNHLNELCILFLDKNPDTVLLLATEALNIITPQASLEFGSIKEGIEENGLKNIRGNTLNIIGRYYYMKGDYYKSLEYQLKTLKIREDLQKPNGVANSLINIGNIYNSQGDCAQALECYFRALKIKEELGDEKAIATALGNIGIVYTTQKDYNKALDYLFRAIEITKKLDDKIGQCRNLCSIGSIYNDQNEYNKALDVLLKAQQIANEIEDNTQQTIVLSNLGDSYYRKKDYLLALEYYSNSNTIAKELGNKYAMTCNFGNLGIVYKALGRFKESETYLKQTIVMSDSLGLLEGLCMAEEEISSLFDTLGRDKEALVHYKKAAVLKDSMYNEGKQKQLLQKELKYEFEKRELITKATYEREKVVATAERNKQRVIIWSVILGLCLVLIFSVFVLRSLKIARKQKIIIEAQKNEVLIQKELVEKQKEKITDSINYAQRIQQSILIEESEIQKILPESFIYFQPKDIVSGDFYWFSKVDNKIVLAVVDCTGHGVPGAFMSMIGNLLLNKIVNEQLVTKPSEILRLLNQGVYDALQKNKESSISKDGMDIALCCIDYNKNEIQYAGAQNPLFIINNNVLEIIKADNQTIGDSGKTGNERVLKTTYTNHVIPIKEQMCIYLFSDGYLDQFGGENRKKLGSSRFKELLLQNHQLSMRLQCQSIVSFHKEWRGKETQIDDILVVGVRV